MNNMDNSVLNIKNRGHLRVGVSLGLLGLSEVDTNNKWHGFDVDLAKAISIAIFNDKNTIEFIPLSSEERFKALQNDKIDIGSFNSSITISREINNEITFCHPMLYDGEMLLTRKNEFELESKNNNNIIISALEGSTTADNINRFLIDKNLKGTTNLYKTFSEARNAYESGICNYYCLDGYLLAGERTKLKEPDLHKILRHMVSREAMSPATLSSKSQLTSAATWILRGIIESEEIEITSKNIDTFSITKNSYIEKFLNPDITICNKLGVTPKFTRNILKELGNYGEIFERNLGIHSILNEGRKENKLRSKGGMLYSPLFI